MLQEYFTVETDAASKFRNGRQEEINNEVEEFENLRRLFYNCMEYYSKNFEEWLKSKFENRMKSYNFTNNLDMLKKALEKNTICTQRVKQDIGFKNITIAKDGQEAESVTTYSIAMKKFEKVNSITFHNGDMGDRRSLENSNKFSDNSNGCEAFDCKTFLMFHHFDLIIENVEAEMHFSGNWNENRKSHEYITTDFVMGSLQISGKATKTFINITKGHFSNYECISWNTSNTCESSQFEKPATFIFQDFHLSLSLVEAMLAPLRRSDEDDIMEE